MGGKPAFDAIYHTWAYYFFPRFFTFLLRAIFPSRGATGSATLLFFPKSVNCIFEKLLQSRHVDWPGVLTAFGQCLFYIKAFLRAGSVDTIEISASVPRLYFFICSLFYKTKKIASIPQSMWSNFKKKHHNIFV